jgi:hypothetical protein
MALVGEQIPDYVKNQIKVRQKAHGSGTSSNLLRTDETLIYTNSRNAFIKMASGVSVSKDKLREIGYGGADLDILQGMGLAKTHVLFGGTSIIDRTSSGNGVLQQKTDFLGINGAYSADPDFGIVPMPGIESLEIKSLNRGSLKKATVKLTAQTRNQLAVLDLLYMRLGYTVLIEWGNSIYIASKNRDTIDKQKIESGRLQQMYTSIIEDNNLWFNPSWSADPEKKSYGRSPADITGKIAEIRDLYDGNFDALLGKVSNFNWTFNPDGSYSIELTIISLGDVVESIKSNVPAAYNTMKYVNDTGTAWLTEDDTLDQHRKDNIILSLLHTLRVLNQNPTGERITISTKKPSDPEYDWKQTAYPGYLLKIGDNIITGSSQEVTYTYTVGWKDETTGNFIEPSQLEEGYYSPVGIVYTLKEAQEQVQFSQQRGVQAKTLDDYKGYGYDVQDIGNGVKRARLVFKFKTAAKVFTESKTFNSSEWSGYITPPVGGTDTTPDQAKDYKDLSKSANPVSKFRYNFFSKYNDFKFNVAKEQFLAYSLLSDVTREFLETKNPSEQLEWIKKDNRPFSDASRKRSIIFAQEPGKFSKPVNIQSFQNPLKGTGYEDNDAFVLNLDKPQYYIRFGYLLDLLKKKVITRINTGQKDYDKNPNLFNIDTNESNNLMLCLPNQISFDWRTCIVKRNDFNRPSWQQRIFPQLKDWFTGGDNNTAYSLNVYLNFNFIAESMTSNTDDRGNVSVYDFIKSMCDGINKSLGGINNLEPIIDEDTNTLRIFESSPIPKGPVDPGYKLQLYGYGNGTTSPKDSSTFVRKVDLKTAITPEYATMITVGATANGYVKGTEATAFARWNSGLTDRFKSDLLAADSETKINDSNDREDAIANFESAMNWTARCFGIEGAGTIWECFPQNKG